MGEYDLRRSWKVFLGKERLRFKGRKKKKLGEAAVGKEGNSS